MLDPKAAVWGPALDVAKRGNELREALETRRRFRVEQLRQLAAEATTCVDDSRREVTRVLTEAAEHVLSEVTAALRRLDHGCYGTCERCGERIPGERLRVLPMARLCFSCHYVEEASRERGAPASLDPDLRSSA